LLDLCVFQRVQVGGIDHADVNVNLGTCQGSVTEKVLQSQDAVGIVLDMVTAKTVTQAMGVEFLR